MTDLGRKMKPASVTQEDSVNPRSRNSHVADVGTSLARSEDHDHLTRLVQGISVITTRVLEELTPRLELGAVHPHGDVLDSRDVVRDVGRDMETGAHGDGITFPLVSLAGGLNEVRDGVFAAIPRVASDRFDCGVEVDVGPQAKVSAVIG